MSHNCIRSYSGNDTDDTFELLEQSETGQRSHLSTIHDDLIKPTSGLPAKGLPLRTATQTVRSIFWVGCLAIAIVTTLSIVASKITSFEPDTSRGSCDLMYQNESVFQNAFTMNLRGSRKLTFPQAKAVDTMWQLFAGMGGRLVMALVAYKVFMDELARIMEDSAVPYQLYASLTFSTTSLLTTGRAIKGAMYTKGWRGKAFFVWFAVSSIYVLGFPTLISATAGYLTPSTAGFRIDNSTFLTLESPALKSCYIVTYGALIGLQNGSIAEGPPISQLDIVNDDGTVGNISWVNNPISNISDLGIPNFQFDYPIFASLLNGKIRKVLYSHLNILIHSTEQYITYPHFYYKNSSSDDWFMNVTIAGEVYNFTNFEFIAGDAFVPAHCYDNKTLPYLPNMAECLPQKYFVWGLSSLLLRIVLILQIIWTAGMYLVWLDASIYSAVCRSGRSTRGEFRAAADLSEAMGEVLGHEICAYSNDELYSALSRESGLRYYATEAKNNDVAHIGISSFRLGKVPYNSSAIYGERRKDR